MDTLQKRIHCKLDFDFVLFEKCTKKTVAKAPKKKSVSRKKSALHKNSEEDLAKQVAKRKTQKKTVVSKTIAPDPDKSMMLRKRKTMPD